jgi:hypothetical protein
VFGWLTSMARDAAYDYLDNPAERAIVDEVVSMSIDFFSARPNTSLRFDGQGCSRRLRRRYKNRPAAGPPAAPTLTPSGP